MSIIAQQAGELGVDLTEEAVEALDSLDPDNAASLLDQVASRIDKIKNHSDYVIRTIERGYNPPKGKGRGDEGVFFGGKGSGKRHGGGKSSARAEELGIEMDDEAREALAQVALPEALALLDDIASKGTGKNGIRNPSSYISTACRKLEDGKGGKGYKGKDGKGKGGGKKGGKSITRALELGIELDEAANEALVHIPLNEAYILLEEVAAKGVGKGGIYNPSRYITTACERIFENTPHAFAPGRAASGKGYQGSADPRPFRSAGVSAGPGTKSAARATELGLDLNAGALEALSTVPLRAAMDLLDDVAVKGSGKGGIRNPSGYIIKACNVMNNEQADDFGTSGPISPIAKGGHKGSSNAENIESRVVELNRIGTWGGEKIDVEAMMILRELPAHHAHELLDSLEGKTHIKNPSNYINAAASRINVSPEFPRKRQREWEAGATPLSAALKRRLNDLGVELTIEASSTLAAQHVDDANELLDQVASKLGNIKDPSKYLMAACKRGIATFPQEGGLRPTKWPRVSADDLA